MIIICLLLIALTQPQPQSKFDNNPLLLTINSYSYRKPGRQHDEQIMRMYKQQCLYLNYVPFPQKINCGKETLVIDDPCQIEFMIGTQILQDHIVEIIKHQMQRTLRCKKNNIQIKPFRDEENQKYKIYIQSKEYKLQSVFGIEQEKYQMNIEKEKSTLITNTYVGIVRGLQTFMQSLHCNNNGLNCTISKLPLQIIDQPAFPYRGLMIDTSRHFLPTKIILQTIDAMMYNKLNVLHWHIVDEDSFPLILHSHPQMAQYGAFSKQQTYSPEQVRQIVAYAMIRGVRVIPEIDTPGHAYSWGLAPQNKNVTCSAERGRRGSLDVTLSQTYKLIQQVFAEIFDIFPDPYVHLGGDQVVLRCLSNKTDFTIKEKITQFELQAHYRRKQKGILKSLNSSKKFIYWANSEPTKAQKGDTLQWWGDKMATSIRQNDIIISLYRTFYLDMGVGNYFGAPYGDYQTWYSLFNNNIRQIIAPFPQKKNVIGAEVCLWSEISNQYVHHTKIWIRTTAFAEKVWNTANFRAKPEFLTRLTRFEKLMNRRGIPTSAATSQKCQENAEYCI